MSDKIPCFVLLILLYCSFCFLAFSDYTDFLVGLRKSQVVENLINRNGLISVGAKGTQNTQKSWEDIEKYHHENFINSGAS